MLVAMQHGCQPTEVNQGAERKKSRPRGILGVAIYMHMNKMSNSHLPQIIL